MYSLIFSDFDNTLFKGNIEKSFLLYIFKKYNFIRLQLSFNALAHFILKVPYKIFNQNYPYKLFYRNFKKSFLEDCLVSFFKDKRKRLFYNETVTSGLGGKNKLIILSQCPGFIVEFICQNLILEDCKIIGTKLHTENGKLTGRIKMKVNSRVKKFFCKKIIMKEFVSGHNFFSKGYGDSLTDKLFLSCVDKAYTFNKRIKSNEIKYLESVWINSLN